MYLIELPRIGDTIPVATQRRDSGNSLGAFNDVEAYRTFLLTTTKTGNTKLRYFYALNRFMAWLELERRLTLAEVTAQDVYDFCQALWQSGPHWMMQVHAAALQRHADLVKQAEQENLIRPKKPRPPRIEPLDPKTIESTVIVLQKFFAILHRSDYLRRNPISAFAWTEPSAHKRVIAHIPKAPRKKSAVAIPKGMWRAILLYVFRQLQRAPRTSKEYFFYAKWRLSLICMYECGMRVSEAATHSTSNIVYEYGLPWLSIIGKGKRKRKVPATRRMQRHIAWFRHEFDITADQKLLFLFRSDRDGHFLINEPMHRALAFKDFKQIVSRALVDTKARWRIDAAKDTITVHSIRHTRLTHLAWKLTPQQLSDFAGHSNFETTMQYYHADQIAVC